MSQRHLPQNLTSYDLLKSFAVLLMMVDHAGYYFAPDEEWPRVIGRFCVPIWFFLIGYARSRDLGPRLWVGALILIIASGVIGMGFFPFNILITIIILRLSIDAVMNCTQQNRQALWQIATLFLVLTIITSYAFEYGTLAFVMAMFGWLVRHQNEYPEGRGQTQMFGLLATLGFIVLQSINFQFADIQIAVMALGIIAVMVMLYFYRPVVFEGTGKGVKGALLSPLRFFGRYTLEIYVVHLLIFKLFAVNTQPDRFHWFDWRLLPPPAPPFITG